MTTDRMFSDDAAEGEFRTLALRVADKNGISFEDAYALLKEKTLENLEKLEERR